MARTTYFFDESDSDRHKKKYHLSMEFLDKTLDLGLFQIFRSVTCPAPLTINILPISRFALKSLILYPAMEFTNETMFRMKSLPIPSFW